MLINESLEKYGLSPKESKVYLACLELGNSTVQVIAKKAELPRSTTYSVLESLIKQKLVFPLRDHKIMTYYAEDPQKLMNISEESTRSIKASLPELKTLFRSSEKGRPKIKYYEGLNGVKEMYDDIIRTKGLKEYLIFAPEDSWMQMDVNWISNFKKRRAAAKIKTRTILNDSPLARQAQKDAGKFYAETKILTDKNASNDFNAGVYIFRDKIILIDYTKNLIAVEIQSKNIADTQRLMFESLWKTLPEYHK
ncbi:MAG: helix-turn-helix domain-containing protein [bacterium]|nr:helix-turn-helix domain-containing protein [bacterium]